MNATLSPILVQRFDALQGELMPEVAAELGGLSPKLEQVIRVLEWSRSESPGIQRRMSTVRGACAGRVIPLVVDSTAKGVYCQSLQGLCLYHYPSCFCFTHLVTSLCPL